MIDNILKERALTLFSTGKYTSRKDAMKAAIEEKKRMDKQNKDKEINEDTSINMGWMKLFQ